MFILWIYYISLSEKFLSFYEQIIDAQRCLFYIILSKYVRFILFCWDKHRDISHTWFHVCTVVRNTFAKERHFPDNLIESFIEELILILKKIYGNKTYSTDSACSWWKDYSISTNENSCPE